MHGAVLTPYERALANAWDNAERAESLDSAGRYVDRDVSIDLANMWARVALAEASNKEEK